MSLKKRDMRVATDYAINKLRDRYGTHVRAGKALGTTAHNLRRWQQRGQVSANFALRVAELTGVSQHELRPDVFGPQPKSEDDDKTSALTAA